MSVSLNNQQALDVLAHLSVHKGVYVDTERNRTARAKGVCVISDGTSQWVCPMKEGGMFTLRPLKVENGFVVGGELASVGCVNGPSSADPYTLISRFFVGSENTERLYLPIVSVN